MELAPQAQIPTLQEYTKRQIFEMLEKGDLHDIGTYVNGNDDNLIVLINCIGEGKDFFMLYTDVKVAFDGCNLDIALSLKILFGMLYPEKLKNKVRMVKESGNVLPLFEGLIKEGSTNFNAYCEFVSTVSGLLNIFWFFGYQFRLPQGEDKEQILVSLPYKNLSNTAVTRSLDSVMKFIDFNNVMAVVNLEMSLNPKLHSHSITIKVYSFPMTFNLESKWETDEGIVFKRELNPSEYSLVHYMIPSYTEFEQTDLLFAVRIISL